MEILSVSQWKNNKQFEVVGRAGPIIFSVKRLSDGAKFKLGDGIFYNFIQMEILLFEPDEINVSIGSVAKYGIECSMEDGKFKSKFVTLSLPASKDNQVKCVPINNLMKHDSTSYFYGNFENNRLDK